MRVLDVLEGMAKPDDRGCWVMPDRYVRQAGGLGGGGGYAYITILGRSVAAHRVAYELATGHNIDGLTIDHLCRNRACVNPAHLEAVERGVNVLRGEGPTAINALKTHCPRGHPYDEANTYYDPKYGYRYCRTCMRSGRRSSTQNQRGGMTIHTTSKEDTAAHYEQVRDDAAGKTTTTKTRSAATERVRTPAAG